MFDVGKPVSPMLQFIEVQEGVAVYHKINYLEDCDRFVVEEVLKFNVDDWTPVRAAAPGRSSMRSIPVDDPSSTPGSDVTTHPWAEDNGPVGN